MNSTNEILAQVQTHITNQTQIPYSLATSLGDSRLPEATLLEMFKGYQYLEQRDSGRYSGGQKEVGYYIVSKTTDSDKPTHWAMPTKILIAVRWI